MIEKVTGFIIYTSPFRETSLVLQLFTKEHGMISVMAKGVKSLKSPLRALTLPFTYGNFYLYYKEEKMSILKDVDVINPFFHIHENILLMSYLNYIANLSSQVYKESLNKGVFDLMMATIFKMEEGFDPAVLANILEVKYLPMLGVGISLDACISCGSTHDIVTMDGDRGGLICRKCYHGEKIVQLKTIKFLRLFQYLDIAKITKLDVKKENQQEIERFLQLYYARYTGLYLQSKEFIYKMRSEMDG